MLSLVSDAEIQRKSPGYLRWLKGEERGDLQVIRSPVPDFGIPDEPQAFRRALEALAGALRNGQTVLIHCAADVGRTGTAAVCLLTGLGFPVTITRSKPCLWADCRAKAVSAPDVWVLHRRRKTLCRRRHPSGGL